MKLKSNFDDKYNEDRTNMKHEFTKQTEKIDKLSKQYSQLFQEHNKKLHSLATENTQKFEQEKENLLEEIKQNRTCCICWEKLSSDDAKPLLCGHDDFHKECVNKWLKMKKTCPACRANCRTRTDPCKFKHMICCHMLYKHKYLKILT